MKQIIVRAIIALFVLNGVMFITQTCSAAPRRAAYRYQTVPSSQTIQRTAYVNPAIGSQAQSHPVSLTQMRTGYTRGEIRAMPMVSRPNRPGHFIGNTVRRRAGVGY